MIDATAGVSAKLIALVGPTAVGKTAVAVELCQRLGGEIIGADSVQVYRGFDVGSNKPTSSELRGVRHHLIDVLEPTQTIDAAAYARLADAAIADVHARGRVAVVVGGTGLWLRALLRGLVELPPPDPELRRLLEREFAERGPETMHARLRSIDPLAAARIHPSDMIRTVRALEVHAQTGKPLGELRKAHALGAPRHDALVLLLDLPRPTWRDLVAARTAQLMRAGFVDEVRGLVARHGADLRALRAVGYRQLVQGLTAGADQDTLSNSVTAATLLYGRRQRTWFRSDPSVTHRCSPTEASTPEWVETLQAHLSAS